MRIGILGGSFDPVHLGHLVVAQDAFEQLRLDRVVFVPAAQAPLRTSTATASAGDRLDMAQAAVKGDPRFEVSDTEIRRGGVSYSIDTAREFRAEHPGAALFWILGADQWTRLPLWRDIAGLASIVEFIVVGRPGHDVEPPEVEIPGLRWQRCGGHLMEISSTELRTRMAAGRRVDFFVPPAVASLIKERSLYRPK